MSAQRGTVQGIINLQDTSSSILIEHHHDWSRETLPARSKMINGDQNPFSSENTYSWIQRTNGNGKILWKRPSPAFSWIGLTPDAKYLVALSNIQYTNPFQLAVFDTTGRLLFRKHITSEVACLSPSIHAELMRRYPEKMESLKDNTWKTDSIVYVDFLIDNAGRRLGSLFKELFAHSCPSPLSSDIDETVSNWVFWFDEKNPNPRIIEENGKPSQLIIRGRSSEDVKVLINEASKIQD